MSENAFKYKGVTWSLPLMFQYEPVYKALKKTFELYNLDLGVVYLYGAPASIWSGGRPPTVFSQYTKEKLLKTLNFVKELNGVPSFTFSCTDITKEALNDKYANFILETAFEVDSRFIVYSDMLKDYIKSKNPKATVVSSVIKPALRFQGADKIEEPDIESETAYYNKLLKEYDIVVVRPEYSKTVLQNHPEVIDDISRIEALINQPCAFNCPLMPEHYRFMEKARLVQNKDSDNYFKCIREEMPRYVACETSVSHTETEVQKLVQNGVKHLKLQGRSDNFEMNSLLMLLYTQMCYTDGANYMLTLDIAKGALLFSAVEDFLTAIKET